MKQDYLPVYFRSDTERKEIAITVDDCDRPENLRRILDLFDSADAGLTLFPIGRTFSLPGMEEMLKHSVFDRGYEIENHTMSHARIFRAPEREMAREIWEQGEALNRLLGVCYRQHFFRLMGGDGYTCRRIHNYLLQLGFRGIAEWSCCGTDVEMAEIRDQLAPGAIYLFHTLEGDVEKLRSFLPYVLSEGYRPVTLSRLLGLEPNRITEYSPFAMPEPRPYREDYRACGKGEYTWNIYRMQERLVAMNLLTIDDGRITGYYGDLTVAAIRRFQEKAELPVTGEADGETQRRLLER